MIAEARRHPTLWEVAADLAENRPLGRALVCDETHLTWAELVDRSARLAAVLTEQGVRPGDRIAWLGLNCHRIYELMLAAARIGAHFAPLNWRLSTAEISGILADLAPAVVVHQNQNSDALFGLTKDSDALFVDAGENSRYEALIAASIPASSTPASDADAAVLVLFTGAFGGTPNGSMLSSVNLLTQGLHLGAMMQIDRRFTYLNSGPLFHIATTMVAVATLMHGGTNVIVAKADAEAICTAIATEQCTSGFILPQVAEQVAREAQATGADLSSFRSNLDVPGWRDLVSPDHTAWGLSSNGYGQTELAGNVAHGALLSEGPLPLGVGLAAPLLRVAVFDGAEISGAPGTVGEILVKGPVVHQGYWNRAELNVQRFRDGWWHTGDLGEIGADGRLVFHGSSARLIKTGLENVYPAEVEATLRRLDGVLDAGVIGVPDETWGQIVRAVVQVQPGSGLDEATVIAHVRSHIASYKKPRSVVLVESPLPRNGHLLDYDALDLAHGGGGYPSSVPARA